jgi:hypothetical protein
MLIDNSKKLSWMQHHQPEDSFAKKYLHIVRDPRGMFFSWLQRGRTTKPSHWAKRTLAIHEGLSPFGGDSKLVLYNELAERPEATLQEIDSWLGISYEPTQREYWRFDHHGYGQNGATLAFMTGAGGADATFYESNARRQFHDLRWREQLDVPAQRKVTEDASVQSVLEELRLRFTETGLERIA